MRWLPCLCIFALMQAAMSPDVAKAQENPDILCSDASEGIVAAVPAPFNKWVRVLCAADGQALTAKAGDRGVLWLIHNTSRPFTLNALPREVPKRQSQIDKLGSRNLRFLGFAGAERRGEARSKLLAMYEQTFEGAEAKSIDAVYQLDTQTIYNGIIYNLFFYIGDNEPKHVIICMQRCKKQISIDVLDLDAFSKRVN